MTVAGIFGRLTWSNLFPSVLVTQTAVVSMGLGLVAVVALVTYLRRWRWLWNEWLTTVDPKRIGVMYIIVAVLMLVRGGVDVILMRGQQVTSVGAAAGVVPTSTFQQLFSAHGTIMIFFVAMGLMFGIINLVVPLQIGARDVAFPFLNATSFWLFCSGMVLINASLGVGEFSAAGWLAYPPLSELQYSPGVGVDYWIWSLQIAGIGSLLSGINFFVTILRMRCRGMTLMRMPLFSWSVLCSMFLVMFAFPVLTVTLTLLFLDRAVGAHFFTAAAGGDMMMYVNLIWAWGHPEVYILVLPGFGIFSEVVATYSRKPLFGYVSMVLALAAITLLSFTVWVHHFFTMGAGADVNAFFGIMTMIIAIPTGVKIFNWLATMYRGRIHFSAPMYFFMGFIFLFTIGGVAGVMLAMPAIDYQLHNSLFLVAHFHTMIVSGVVFGDFAGLIYWLPKIIGFKMDDRLLKYSAWCWIVGFVLAFGPLYLLGFMGATRRTSHYASDTGWQPLFAVAGLGVVIIAVGVAIMLLQLLLSVQRRKQNRDTTGDPWNGRTLEWSIPSPAPVYNFAVLPVVEGRDAFWAAKQRGDASGAAAVRYVDILLPANTPAGLAIGMLAFVVGFALIWQMYWATPLAILAIIVVLAIRTTATDDSERVITAAEVEGIERSRARADLA
jgi:cytochrome o ubiquinol oxidase subunit 1